MDDYIDKWFEIIQRDNRLQSERRREIQNENIQRLLD